MEELRGSRWQSFVRLIGKQLGQPGPPNAPLKRLGSAHNSEQRLIKALTMLADRSVGLAQRFRGEHESLLDLGLSC